jgi:hypothetical protein
LSAKAAPEPNTHRRNLPSYRLHELDPTGLTIRARVSPRPLLRRLPERTGLIAKKSPPRLSPPSASCRKVTRDGGLGDTETEHEKFARIRGAPQRKFSRAIRAIRWRTSQETLGRPPRQRPRDRYRQSADQPIRRQRKTVSAWTITRLSRHCGHQRDPKQPIPTAKARATSSAALQHRNLMAQRDLFQQ